MLGRHGELWDFLLAFRRGLRFEGEGGADDLGARIGAVAVGPLVRYRLTIRCVCRLRQDLSGQVGTLGHAELVDDGRGFLYLAVFCLVAAGGHGPRRWQSLIMLYP